MTAPWLDCEHFDRKHGYCIEGKDCSCGWWETQAAWLDDGDVQLYHGDALDVLRSLPAGSVQTCVTSPPYWGLRDYGTGSWTGGAADCDHAPENARRGIERRSSTLGGGVAHLTAQEQGANAREECPRCGARRVDAQLGLEATPTAYVAALVAVFAEVWRVLRADGTLWLNLGDSYAGSSGNGGATEKQATNAGSFHDGGVRMPPGLKAKDLVGAPWRVAFALQEAGWYLRSDVIWAKPNPMPESVTDRPTKAHEYVFLLAKQPKYYFDADAIREPHAVPLHAPGNKVRPEMHAGPMDRGGHSQWERDMGETWGNPAGRNARSVWEIATQPTPEAHFATFPEALVRRCILAGSREGDQVLDPFVGSGTTCLVARKHGRRAIGIDLSDSYLAIAARRLGQQSLFAQAGGVA